MIRVFTTEVCPKCGRLKSFLDSKEIKYDVMDMQSPEGMAELFSRAVFVFDAPVLQCGENFYTTKQLFKGVQLQENVIIDAVNEANDLTNDERKEMMV